jgi:hypothetical protein
MGGQWSGKGKSAKSGKSGKLLRGRKGVEDRFRFLAELVYLNGTSENYRIFRYFYGLSPRASKTSWYFLFTKFEA